MAQHADDHYYVPHGTKWPIIGSIGMIVMMVSAAYWVNGSSTAPWTFLAGTLVMIYMMFGWFGDVIKESEAGLYNAQVDTSFRMGMLWFIASEVMFFAAFFGALFYARMFAVPWLGKVLLGTTDPDLGVRRRAVTRLAALGDPADHGFALWCPSRSIEDLGKADRVRVSSR